MSAPSSPPLPRKLWTHPDPSGTAMHRFMHRLNGDHDLGLDSFRALHAWSTRHRAAFWAAIFAAACLLHEGDTGGRPVVDEAVPIDAVPRWFEGVRLNFAENLLYGRTGADAPGHRGTVGKEDAKVAVTEIREGRLGPARELCWADLRRRAGRLAAAMRAAGVRRGDRVVAVGANSVETLLVWLATTWLGGLFSSSSTDMGTEGILQRTVQVQPRMLFMDDAALYNGRVTDLRPKMAALVDRLKDGPAFLGLVSMPRFADEPRDVGRVPQAQTWADFLFFAQARSAPVPDFVRVAFHEPFLIGYSSGTTGTPKAIVHSVGGCLLNMFKEAVLHEGQGPDTVSLQYTTTGWIMYLSSIGVLLSGGRCVLYDGSPFLPDAGILIRVAAEQKATKLGISPRWMSEVAKSGLVPRELADLSSLRLVSSTGMVLSDQLFAWFYDQAFPPHVQLGNISGGTDIAGCFGIMNPLEPVYVGGTQGPSLGVPIAIYDTTLADADANGPGPGRPVPDGTAGELVAVAAFPNMPCCFWGDGASSSPGPGPGPGPRYRAAYFARFRHAWAHGDFCTVHPATGGLVFLGRADGVLNPSGVRFGSADVYAVLERRFSARVADALCVGQRRPGVDDDERVLLFLLLRPGAGRVDARLVADVKAAIRADLSPRHVPKYVFETWEIPMTVNMKKVELPVKQIVSGQTVRPSGTLLNPNSLEFYYQFAEVEKLVGGGEKL